MNNKITHGMTKTKEYYIWAGMKQRCTNPNDKKFNLYGGRGIKVCKQWQSFEGFIEGMGSRPGPKYSIDRRDSEGDYTPDNCRWTLIDVQNHNRRPYNKLNQRNIRLTSANTFQVIIARQGKVLYKTFKTLEAAISGRQKLERSLYE